MKSILEISNLTVSFPVNDELLSAIDDINLSVKSGETLAIIGESGSGKSILGLSILMLLPDNTKFEGCINFRGKNLLNINESEMESIRGSKITWISQNPKTSFNPSMKMWKQIAETNVSHEGLSWSIAKQHSERQLEQYNILPASYWGDEYPITFSGGMLQRAMIAMGTSLKPEIIIADEPTKGIDRINKIEIVKMFNYLKSTGITLMLITHDLDFANELADRVVVMYCGQIVEISANSRFLSFPLHPYTSGLINSLPENGLHPITGSAPPMHLRGNGCRFKERCNKRIELCNNNISLLSMNDDYVRCINYNICKRSG